MFSTNVPNCCATHSLMALNAHHFFFLLALVDSVDDSDSGTGNMRYTPLLLCFPFLRGGMRPIWIRPIGCACSTVQCSQTHNH